MQMVCMLLQLFVGKVDLRAFLRLSALKRLNKQLFQGGLHKLPLFLFNTILGVVHTPVYKGRRQVTPSG